MATANGYDPFSHGAQLQGYQSPRISFFRDFLVEGTATTGSNTTEWFTSLTGSGTSLIRDDQPGGVIRLLTGATDDNQTDIQLNGESFGCVTGKSIDFAARVALEDVDLSDFFIGLADTNTDVTNGVVAAIGFRSGTTSALEDQAALDIIACNASAGTAWTSTTTQTASDTGVNAADNTFQIFSFHVDVTSASSSATSGTIRFYIDNALVATHTTNLPLNSAAEALTPTLAISCQSGAAEALDCDWIYVAQDR